MLKRVLCTCLFTTLLGIGTVSADTVIIVRGPLSDGFPEDGKVNVSIVQGRNVVFSSAKSGNFAEKRGFDYAIRLRFKGDFDPNRTVSRVCVAGFGSAAAIEHGGCVENPEFDRNNTLFYPVPRGR